MWNIYTRDYYSAIKRNDIMPLTAIWTDTDYYIKSSSER